MARKKKQEEHENHERWLVSYADFITLLFAFFVVMYSVSSVNEGKFRVLSDALLSAFHSAPKSLDPIQVGQPSKSPVMTDLQFKSSPNILISQKKGVDYEDSDGAKKLESVDDISHKSSNDKQLGKIADDVVLAMANLIDLGIINVRRTDLWLEIEINNSILFRSGDAKLKEEVLPVLKGLANILYAFPNAVRIEGYTDSDKIHTDKFPSNWELSSARASSIARIFEMSNMLPERLSVVGYGSTRPVSDNSTVEGRAKNRRVVIVVVANNDVAKTIKHSEKAEDSPFPDSAEMVKNGLVDPYIEAGNNSNIGPDGAGITDSGDRLFNTDVGLNDKKLSLYRDAATAGVPEASVDSDSLKIINPTISGPIRLFSPIVLPKPITINNSSSDSKE